MVFYIEFVCTGGNTRSRLLKFAANRCLQHYGIEEYQAVSSGAMLYDLQRGSVSTPTKRGFLERAIEGGFFEGEARLVRLAIEGNNEVNMHSYYTASLEEYVKRETKVRDRLFEALGVDTQTPPEQTMAREGVVAIFPVTQTNKRRVERIYSDVEAKPIIHVFSGFATGNLDAPVDYPVWQPEGVLMEFYEGMLKMVPIVLQKLLSELGYTGQLPA